MTRRRVLIIAESCNPEWVSVPLVGWSHAAALREIADVHLVTHPRNLAALLRAGLREGVDFTTLSHDRVARPLLKVASLLGSSGGKGWTIYTAALSLAYPAFERLVWRHFGDPLRRGEFDLVHQLTPLTPTSSPTLARLCARTGVPFVWGPINGGAPWPRQFHQARRLEREWLSRFRSAYKHLPRYHISRRHAAAIIVGSRDTLRQVPARYHHKCVYIPENAVDPERFGRRRTRRLEQARRDGQPLRLVFLGRLVPYKGPDMALEAARPLLERGDATFTIIGDGPLRDSLATQAQGVPGVEIRGHVPHGQVQDALAEADLLVFPSIREFGGAAALEAMAVGLPAMVVDYAGPAELVTEETGWLIPLRDRAGIVSEVRATLERILADPAGAADLDARGERALARIERHFTWPIKARQVAAVWDWVLGESEKPDFGMPL